MYADSHYRPKRYAPIGRTPATQKALRDDQDLVLRIVMSSMPLAGLVFGVVALALWNAG